MSIVECIDDPNLIIYIATKARSYTLWRILHENGVETERGRAIEKMKNKRKFMNRLNLAITHDFMDVVHFGFGRCDEYILYYAVKKNNMAIVREMKYRGAEGYRLLSQAKSIEMFDYLASLGERPDLGSILKYIEENNLKLVDRVLNRFNFDIDTLLSCSILSEEMAELIESKK